MDVRSLYTNIPNNERIKAVETALKRKNRPAKVIIKLFTNKRMCNGNKMRPTYANIFMGIFEETHIYPLIKQKVQLYLRYIDDIFFISTGSENDI